MDRPLRIVHLVSYHPPDRVGGVGEVVDHLHRGLLEAGHRSTVVTSGSSHDDPSVLRVCASPAGIALAPTPASVFDDVDIVHTHHGEAARMLFRLRRAPCRVLMTLHVDNRLVARSHRPTIVDGRRRSGGRGALLQRCVLGPSKVALDRAAIPHVDALSFISRAGAREVLGEIRGGQADVVYNGVPVADTNGPTARVRTSLLYVGTAGTRKRVELLPSILARVRRRHPDATLRIVGFDRDEAPAVARELTALGLSDAVRFEGRVRSAEIGAFYRAADVLVVPSAYEGLPMVIIEAAAHGLCAVATDAGGTAEAVQHRTTGLLAPVDDPDALAERCCEALDDRVATRAMGVAATALARTRFSLDRQRDGYLDIYRRLLG